MTFTENNIKARDVIITWLASLPVTHHLTLSFHANTNHDETKKLLDLFFKHLNRRIYKGRYNKGLSYIRGIVIRENTPGLLTDHYHILILDEDRTLPDHGRLQSLISKTVRSLKGSSYRNRNHIKAYLLQPYSDEAGENRLEAYLLKSITGILHKTSAFDQIGCLDPDKVIFGQNFTDSEAYVKFL